MSFCSLVLLAVAALPPIQAESLQGQQLSGELQSLDSTAATVQTPTGPEKVPAAELLELRFTAETPADPAAAAFSVSLADGSQLGCSSFSITGRTAVMESVRLGKLSLPINAVSVVRLAPLEAKFADAWDGLLKKDSKKDLLIIRKGDLLDFLSGVIGDVNETHINFLLDQDELSIKRDRVFGLIYQRPVPAAKPICTIELAGGDALRARSITFNGTDWKATLPAGPEVTLPPEALKSIDFSLGKVKHLSQLTPRDVEYVPGWRSKNWNAKNWKTELQKKENQGVHLWEYRTDRTTDGLPLRIGDRTFTRGLWIHSRTVLRYRIGGEYRRFQTTLGIDSNYAHAEQRHGHVQVVIRGDGKVLYQGEVKWSDPAVPLALDVPDVRDLEIEVGFRNPEPVNFFDLVLYNEDHGDHLVLGDAKLLK